MSHPSLDLEAELLNTFDLVIGVDEVGRGALAGPVAVGAVAITNEHLGSMPEGVRDSKLVPESKRGSISELISSWAEFEVGYSGVEVIEAQGITKALKMAAIAAIRPLVSGNCIILLDGSQNWLVDADLGAEVTLRVKADRDHGSVSAAALMAKVSRDNQMRELHREHPEYDWHSNKGYASNSHIAALQSLGPTEHHRLSWLAKILSDQNSLF
ncbi:MAG: ribonuclease HII [Aquiluna sp.]|nr:ribonuclease HII [Aquiluna sp.]MCF8545286.1 ribonuclease HII [Aquiluna sp.]